MPPTLDDRAEDRATWLAGGKITWVDAQRDLEAYYDREAAAGARASMGSRGRRDVLRGEFVDRLLREGRHRLVDVGSGPGTDIAAFTSVGIDVVGFDISMGNAQLGRKAGLQIVQASLYAPPFRAGSFDAGWTMSTFLHVPDAHVHRTLADTMALLRRGAPLAIGLWGGVDREWVNDSDHFDPPRFYSLRSDRRAEAMLSEHGEVESFESWVNDGTSWSYQFAIVRRI